MAPSISSAPMRVGRVRTGKSATYVTSTHRFLATTQFEPSHFPLLQIAPRPDSERTSGSRYSWAHSGFAYDVPVAVQGGAPPFKFELVSGPTGATCVAEAPDWNPHCTLWGRVNWPSPSGTGTFRVRVIDSEGSTLLIEWTCVQNNTKFRFLDATNGDDANNGVLVADGGTGPWQTISLADTWPGTTTADATYANLIMVYRAGTYAVPAQTAPAYCRIDNNKPRGHIRYPGEDAKFDFANGRFVGPNSYTEDWFFQMGSVNGTTEDNPRLYEISNAAYAHRLVWDQCSFDGPTPAVVGDSNNGCIVLMDSQNSAHSHEYIAIVDCSWNDLSNVAGNNGFSCFDLYTARYVVCAGGTGTALNGNFGWWLKGSNDTCSLWGMNGWDETGNTLDNSKVFLQMSNNDYPARPRASCEVGYCKLYVDVDGDGTQRSVYLFGSANPWGPIYAYRMTLAGTVHLNGTAAVEGVQGTATMTDCLVYSDSGTPIGSEVDYSTTSVAARSAMATELTDGNVNTNHAYYGLRGGTVAQA